MLAARAAFARRPAPTWGCGGELTAEAEYTATAFSKPLMLIFGAIYRPMREVSTLETARYYAREVRYRAEVEPTFERFVYRPLTRGVLGLAERLRVIQAGSLHAYLGYVMALVLLPRGLPVVAGMSQSLFPLGLALHATGVAFALVLRRHPAACRWAAFLASLCGSLASFALGASVLANGRSVRGILFANAAAGVSVGYTVDPLSAWFLVTLAVLAAPLALYSVAYLAHAIPPGRTAFVGVAWNVLLLSVETVFAADGVLGFLVAWELMSLATAALVATDHESRPSRRSAYLYLVMSHLGTGCLVAGVLPPREGCGLARVRRPAGRHRGSGRCAVSSSSSFSWASE